MTARLKFFKMAGAGNDFVLVFNPPKSLRGPDLARRLCDRRRGIGADGLLFVKPAAAPRLEYFNSDGSAAFCGNGARCAAWWLFRHKKIRGKAFSLRAEAGLLRARIGPGGRAAIEMPQPGPAKLGLKLRAAGGLHTIHWICAGVPHALVESANPGRVDLERLGPLLRRHKALGRAGANIDVASFKGRRVLLRTFERGVEGETLACGTGAVAAALIGLALGRLRGAPIEVRTAGGEVLNVFFKAGQVWLEGPAAEIFSGEIIP